MTAVLDAAAKLREIILEREDGAYLGSQEDLVRLLGVGRVTLQQTARLLEQERLLRVKRGVNGGYYGTHPDEMGAETSVATYLRAKKATFADTFRIGGVLSVELLRMAAASQNEPARARLERMIPLFEAPQVLESDRAVLTAEAEFWEVIYELADNAFGELMVRINRRIFFDKPPGRLIPDREGKLLWRQARLNMARAILARDEEYVQIVGRNFVRTLQRVLEGLPQSVTCPASYKPVLG